jgi:hypothetical protein
MLRVCGETACAPRNDPIGCAGIEASSRVPACCGHVGNGVELVPAAIARGARLLRGALLATRDSVAVQASLETNQRVPMSRDLQYKAK